MPETIMIDAETRRCPHCGDEIGPISEIHWLEVLAGGANAPKTVEECAKRMPSREEHGK